MVTLVLAAINAVVLASIVASASITAFIIDNECSGVLVTTSISVSASITASIIVITTAARFTVSYLVIYYYSSEVRFRRLDYG